MKYFFLFFIIAVTVNSVKPQINFEEYQNLRKSLDTLIINNLTFNEMYGTQLDEIFMDFKQINEALKSEIDSLKQQKIGLEQNIKEISNQYKLFLYIAIAASSLLLIFIFIWIITLFKHGKTKKLYQQALLEIGKLNAEAEKIKQNFESEKEQQNAILEKSQEEIKKLTSISHKLQDENVVLKNENEKLNNEIKSLNEKFSSTQSLLLLEQAKCEELSAHVNELIETNKNTELQNKNISEQIAKYQFIEQQYQQEIQMLNNNLEQIKQENEILKNELQKSVESEEKINQELKKFIAELQTMLPLPKND